jgi:hypothetical protein
MKVDGLPGAIKPTGYFDPLGFSKGKTLKEMNVYREAELSHGRIAMAACLGWLVQPQFHPMASYLGITHAEDPIKSLYETPVIGWAQVAVFIGLVEWLKIGISKMDGYKAGDYVMSSQWTDNSDAGWLDYQQRELSNGRLAMVAIMGFWIQDLLYGKTSDMLFFPLRQAFEPGQGI